MRAVRSSRESSDGDIVAIAAKVFDIVVDPFEGRALVPEAVVAGEVVGVLLAELIVGKEAECIETVCWSNYDCIEIPSVDKVSWIFAYAVSVADLKPASMDEEEEV